MPGHENLREAIPAYVTSNLAGQERALFERHLEECELCREMVDTWKSLVAAIREGGEALLSPHPDPLVLRHYALTGDAGGREEIARHLTICPSCELEVRVWKEREQGREPSAGVDETAERRAAPRRSWRMALALAAGLAIGVGLATLAPGRFGVAPPGSEASPHGLVPLWVLPGPVRGEPRAVSFQAVGAGSSVLLAIRPVLPPAPDPHERYLLEVREAAAETVWSLEASGVDLRTQLETSEVVTFTVPSAALRPGAYEARLHRLDPAGATLVLELPFEVRP